MIWKNVLVVNPKSEHFGQVGQVWEIKGDLCKVWFNKYLMIYLSKEDLTLATNLKKVLTVPM